MGRAKEKMFGKKLGMWPQLQMRVDAGEFLAVELAYAKLETDDEKQALATCEKLAKARAGYLVDLPKHRHFMGEIIRHAQRLIAPLTPLTIPLPNRLNSEQKKAIETALANRFSIITGGPGTGKTHTAATLIEALNAKTLVAAPTGKAATHLGKKLKSQVTAATLHSLLGVKTPLDYTKSVEELDAELILVDECSMIDPPLFARLLGSIPPSARLVLMGDVNQLPAVEGGSVFADLIGSEKIPTTYLKTCMRSDRKEILDLAGAVLKGDRKEIRTCDLGFTENSVEVFYEKLWHFVKDKDFQTFRILSTLRKGPYGVDALNRFLVEKFGSDGYPILITRNDQKRGFSNGDMAMVEKGIATFEDGRTYPLSELPKFEYAYCISVHKSQGSEYDHVLLLVPKGSEIFGKEVLYTAVTRAKEKLDVDGDEEEIAKALSLCTLKYSSIKSDLRLVC